MAAVRPFRSLCYAPGVGAELAHLLSPPYDVISPQEQEALHQLSPYNVVRLELGKTSPQDTPQDNRYTRARDCLLRWLQGGVLILGSEPALFLCRHDFTYQGTSRSRWELFMQVRLEEWEQRAVLPHEHTLPEPKLDRLRLLRATQTNISPIYALYPDPAGAVADIIRRQTLAAPAVRVPQWREEAFTLWAVQDPKATQGIQRHLANVPLYIADGHHRYETALAYQREQGAAHPNSTGAEGFNYVLMALTSLSDPGLLILPIHRLVKGLQPHQLRVLREHLAREWLVERHRLPSSPAQEGPRQILKDLAEREGAAPRFALYGLEPEELLVLRPRALRDLRRRTPAMAEPLRALDLTLLHHIILHGYLGIGREAWQIGAALGFTHDAQDALEQVDAGAYQLAFLVTATRVERLVAVAEAGEKMPQKSTFFYPKLPAGLVMRPLDAQGTSA